MAQFEALQLIDELRAKIAEAQAEAKQLAAEEASLLTKANAAAESAMQVEQEAKAIEAEVRESLPLLRVLGLEEEAALALSALQDEAASLIQAAKEKQEELVLEAQILWEGHEGAKALLAAEREAEAEREKAKAQAHRAAVARACKALKALVQGKELEELLRLYPKRHGQAGKGQFGDATPNDATSIRLEMLRRSLRGAGFFPSVLDDIPAANWEEANRVFQLAQTKRHDEEETEAQDDDPVVQRATDLLMACGVQAEAIDLRQVMDKNRHPWLRGKVGPQAINLRVDVKDRWCVELQRGAADLARPVA